MAENIHKSVETELEDVEVLIAKMKSVDWKVRLYAINSLAKMVEKQVALKAIIRALFDGKIEVQKAAVKSLGESNNNLAIVALIKNLNSSIAQDCLRSLVKINKPAVPFLIKTLGVRDKYIRWKSIKALGLIGDKMAINPLLNILDDEDELVRMRVVEALGKIGGKEIVNPLIGLLDDEDEYVRIYTIEALGQVKDPRAIQPLEVTYSMKTSTKSIKEIIRKIINDIKYSEEYTEYRADIEKDKELKIEIERRRRHNVQTDEQDEESIQKSHIIKELEGLIFEETKEEVLIDDFDIDKLLDIDDNNFDDLDNINKIEQNKYTLCPYCGKQLIFQITPEFCPFCNELLVIS